MVEMTRPTFLKSLLDSWQLSISLGRERDLIPFWILAAFALGWAVVYFIPSSFWAAKERSNVVSILSATMTFNGIILALCWSAFGKVYEIIGASGFAAHLRKHNLLNHYLVFVGYCHIAQVVAISMTAFALFALWLPFASWFVKLIFGGAVAATAYALRQGVATSTLMQDLIWQKSIFDNGEGKASVQAAQSN